MRISATLAVPSTWFESGTDFIDRAEGWGEERRAEWIRKAYDTRSANVPDSRVSGDLLEDAQPGFRLALTIANADEMPTWYPREDFEGGRVQVLAGLAE
jgi:hypothetical protein